MKHIKSILSVVLVVILTLSMMKTLAPKLLGLFGSDPVAKELVNFNNSVLVPISESLPDNEGIAQSKSTDVMAARIEKEILPTFAKDITSLQNAQLKTKEVQDLRNLYVEGLKGQTDGYKKLAKALRNTSEEEMAVAAKAIDAGKAKIQQARTTQDSLNKKHKIKRE